MIDIEPMDQLLLDEDLALEVFNQIPVNANRMRMNQSYPMFYVSLLVDGEVRMWRYLRYKQNYAPLLSVKGSFKQFEESNNVFRVEQFKLNFYQRYTDKAFTHIELLGILDNQPLSATLYDPIDKGYWRDGEQGRLERFEKKSYNSHKWIETEILNRDSEVFFINISVLNKALKNK